MYGNNVELGHLAVFISSNWWTIFAVFALINLVKFLWTDEGKSGEKKLSRASALARAELDLKRKVEVAYADEVQRAIVFSEESALLRKKGLCPDARSVEQEVKSWSKYQDALAKEREKNELEKERAERDGKEFPPFRQKRRNNRPRTNRPRTNRPRSNRPNWNRPQHSEKTTEIWLPGGQIKRV